METAPELTARTVRSLPVVNFQCTRCDHCCRGDPNYGEGAFATREEIERIMLHLGLPPGRVPSWLAVRAVEGEYRLRLTEAGDCLFLDRMGDLTACAIYPLRPGTCKSFPFWPSLMRRLRALDCPGLGRGQQVEPARIAAMLNAARVLPAGAGAAGTPEQFVILSREKDRLECARRMSGGRERPLAQNQREKVDAGADQRPPG